MRYLTDEELKKLNSYKRQNRVSDGLANFTEQVLEMYENMLLFAKNNDEDKLLNIIKFNGFYADNLAGDETHYLNYAEFLLFKLKKYPLVQSTIHMEYINNQCEQNSNYKRQLKTWKKYNNPTWSNMEKLIVIEILAS